VSEGYRQEGLVEARPGGECIAKGNTAGEQAGMTALAADFTTMALLQALVGLNATKPLEGRILDMDLFTAQEIARATPPSTEGMDAAALEWEIEVISRALKGTGLSQSERIALNEDRRVFRAARAALSPQP
jgi:hypothetical protein